MGASPWHRLVKGASPWFRHLLHHPQGRPLRPGARLCREEPGARDPCPRSAPGQEPCRAEQRAGTTRRVHRFGRTLPGRHRPRGGAPAGRSEIGLRAGRSGRSGGSGRPDSRLAGAPGPRAADATAPAVPAGQGRLLHVGRQDAGQQHRARPTPSRLTPDAGRLARHWRLSSSKASSPVGWPSRTATRVPSARWPASPTGPFSKRCPARPASRGQPKARAPPDAAANARPQRLAPPPAISARISPASSCAPGARCRRTSLRPSQPLWRPGSPRQPFEPAARSDLGAHRLHGFAGHAAIKARGGGRGDQQVGAGWTSMSMSSRSPPTRPPGGGAPAPRARWPRPRGRAS